ncbi:MAG: hypothetical protein R3C12_11900 [Planctomycetaceae bacterium]|nr:hypothetical protein [Planctomycetaceae bacterium]
MGRKSTHIQPPAELGKPEQIAITLERIQQDMDALKTAVNMQATLLADLEEAFHTATDDLPQHL